MAFPTLTSVIVNAAVLLAGAPIVYLSSRALKLRPKPIAIADSRKEATMTLLVIVASFVVIYLLNVLLSAIVYPLIQYDKRPPYYFDAFDILLTVFAYAVSFLPVVIVMKRTNQTLGGIGVSRENIKRAFALGLILAAVLFAIEGFLAPSLGGGFTGFSTSLAVAFIVQAMVGFSEETIWRGYIQTRLVGYSGTLKGLVATSMLFALSHFPARYYFQFSGAPLEALASALLIFPSSLLFGYVMLRSQNVVSSSVFHLFYNWSQVFWQTPSL